jgi:hypothetical protein
MLFGKIWERLGIGAVVEDLLKDLSRTAAPSRLFV